MLDIELWRSEKDTIVADYRKVSYAKGVTGQNVLAKVALEKRANEIRREAGRLGVPLPGSTSSLRAG